MLTFGTAPMNSTERFILDGPFNDIAHRNVHRLGEVFGPLAGYDVESESEFEFIPKTSRDCGSKWAEAS